MMLAGTRIAVGYGHATVLPDMDFETYSEAGLEWTGEKWVGPPGSPKNKKGLSVVGAHRYAEHPTTEVLSLKYDLKDGRGIRFWKPGMPNPQDLFDWIQAGGLVEAWNSAFEYKIWVLCCVVKYGWPMVGSRSFRCAMAKSRAYAGPGKLEIAGEAFNLTIRKDADGTRLLNKFSVPRKPTKKDPRFRIRPEEDLIDGPKLYQYNETDILAEAEASSKCPDLEGEELEYWLCDQEINNRGVAIDAATVENMIVVLDAARAKYDWEIGYLTSGTVTTVSEVQKLTGWLGAYGIHMASMDDDALTEVLARNDLPPACRRALEIRQMMSSASVKKIYAMRNLLANDGRVHDLFTYHGARTGRDTGNDVQPQNLPNSGPYMKQCGCCGQYSLAERDVCSWCLSPALGSKEEWNKEHVAQTISVLGSRDLATVEYFYGSATTAISACLRGMFIAAEGHDLLCADYSAIEAVGLAVLAGEEWRLEVFRTHGKIYEMSASKISGVPFEEFLRHKKETGQHHHLRKSLGKVAELACFGPHTKVLTQRGYVNMVDVLLTDKLWDGEEWVQHQGIVAKGRRQVLNLDGVLVTPQHPISIGSSWREARELVSNESILKQCLENGSANLPWSKRSRNLKSTAHSCNAAAGDLHTSSHIATSISGRPRAAAIAGGTKPAKRTSNGIVNTPRSCRTKSTVGGYSIDSVRQLAAATTRGLGGMRTTAAVASSSTQCGETIEPPSSAIYLNKRGGMTRAWRWTGSIATAITNRVTSALSAVLRTAGINEAFPPCNLRCCDCENVYDIAHAGPRNRFTIKTNSGHLIVHNSGYGGWVNAWKQFGAEEHFANDSEIEAAIKGWRNASPAIVEFWGGQSKWENGQRIMVRYGIEGAAVNAIENPGTWFNCRDIWYGVFDDKLFCRLPSGRHLTYHQPRLTLNQTRPGFQIEFMGYNTNANMGPVGWVKLRTYGGRLVENIVQAACRDILRHAVVNLEAAGYPVVLRVHDEIASEVPHGFGSIEEFVQIMSTMPEWAKHWPVKASLADAFREKRYRK